MIAVKEANYIAADENILCGEPIIKGTRTPVRVIVEIWRLGISGVRDSETIAAFDTGSDVQCVELLQR